MEQPQAAEGHCDAVLVAGVNDLLVADGAAGLHDGGHAGTAGTLDVVAEGEEGIRAKAHAVHLAEIFLLFLSGQRGGLLGKGLGPHIVANHILGRIADVNINGVVTVGLCHIVAEGQVEHLIHVAQLPVVGLLACQTGGALNSLSGTLTPLFVGALIGTVTSSTAMSDVAPLLFVAMGVFVAAFIIISFVAIPEPHLQKGGVKKEKFSHSPWSFRHTLLGVIGIFIYVGIEIGIPGTLNFYLADSSDKGAGIMMNGAAIGGAIAAIYWLLMLVGRTASSAISGKVSSRAQLIAVSATAIIFVLIAIFTPKDVTVSMPGYTVGEGFMMAQVPVSALFLVLCGLCTSVMWGGIFNLAVEGLGKYTAQASGIFMMMVVGGGVLPLIQQSISDSVG